MKNNNVIYSLLLIILVSIIGCGGMKPTIFLLYDYNFNYIERIAVIPFENLSKDKGADERVVRIFISELLAKDAFDIVEPGEVKKVLLKNSLSNTAEITLEQAIAVGKELNVQAILLGTVNESSTTRSGTSSISVVTIVSRLVEVESGTTFWSTTITEGGDSFLSSLFGSRTKSMSEVTRKCVKKTINTLVQ